MTRGTSECSEAEFNDYAIEQAKRKGWKCLGRDEGDKCFCPLGDCKSGFDDVAG